MHAVLCLALLITSLRGGGASSSAKDQQQQQQQPPEHPPPYLESGAPIVILSNASLPVDIRCHKENSPHSRQPRTTLLPGHQWSINLDHATEQDDPLLCTFRSTLRKWNCDERWLIKDTCVWEKHRTLHQSAGGGPNQQPGACPRCDTKNSVGKPICIWTVHNDGIRLTHSNLTLSWREDDPAFYAPTGSFRFSVANFFNNTVKIQCDVVSEVVYLEPFQGGRQHPTWGYEIHPVVDADYTYFTWTCDFEVLGTMLRRGGVQIWSPQPEVNTWIRAPECTDCAWKLDAGGLWLDDRSCYVDRPVWVREHLWDSVMNASNEDEIDWSPWYYPLKKSSHVHHVY